MYDASEEPIRERFAANSRILLFTAGVLILLILFFPKDDILEFVTQHDRPSMVTENYIQNLLDIYPDNSHLRLLLIKQEVGLAQYNDALQHLDAVSDNAQAHVAAEVKWLRYLILRNQTFMVPANTAKRFEKEKQLSEHLQSLHDLTLSRHQRTVLARDAIYLKKVSLAKSFYQYAIAGDKKLSASEYAELAEVGVLVGDFTQAASFYMQAKSQSTTRLAKREYFIKALTLLQENERYKQAIQFAQQYLGSLKNDAKTLRFLVKLALASNRPDLAQDYVKRALLLGEGQPE
jgi:hypothetical protein